MYTTILNQRLKKILEKHNILTPEQTGFRKDMDTSLNINALNRIILDSNKNKKALHVIYIDLSKAYDSLQHWAIQENMEYLGFDKAAIKLIMSLYNKTSADVITDVGVSPKFTVNSGVRQGDPISPTIFIMCMNAILKFIRNTFKGYQINKEKL